MTKKQIALVEGDGAGPEMMVAACIVAIEAAKKDGIEIEFVPTPMGWNAYDKYGDTLPKESMKKATELGVLFFGGVGDPEIDKTIGKEHPEMMPEARCLLTIRNNWKLLLNFRPMIYYKELEHLANVKPEMIPDEGVEQVFIRFLLEDSYFGNQDFVHRVDNDSKAKTGMMLKKEVSGREWIVSDLAYYKRETLEKYFRTVFAYARAKKFPLISIDKANVMARYVFWRKIATRIGREEFPDVPFTHQLVDSANALLFTPAKLHGVIACGNEHGDILSDGAAAALGSMGMMCSSAINPDTGYAMFESGAGTAPTLAGKNEANPLGRILTAAMMLRHIGAKNGADAIDSAVRKVLTQGYRTRDSYNYSKGDGKERLVGTKEMGLLILSNI